MKYDSEHFEYDEHSGLIRRKKEIIAALITTDEEITSVLLDALSKHFDSKVDPRPPRNESPCDEGCPYGGEGPDCNN